MRRVFIVDDHAILRRGLHAILETYPEWEYCGEAESGEAAIEGVSNSNPDVVIMDVSMPGIGGINATKILHQKFPQLKIILFTLHNSTELLRAGLASGATGYVLKSDGEDPLVAALEAVTQDRTYVTPTISREVALKVIQELSQSTDSAQNVPLAKTAECHD
jgi:DNA-binding NarL/FixJ family response regulator